MYFNQLARLPLLLLASVALQGAFGCLGRARSMPEVLVTPSRQAEPRQGGEPCPKTIPSAGDQGPGPSATQGSCSEASDPYHIASLRFPNFNWGGSPAGAKHTETRLPFMLYLLEHDRGNVTSDLGLAELTERVRLWLSPSRYPLVTLKATSQQASQCLSWLAKNHASQFGFATEPRKRGGAIYKIHKNGHGAWAHDMLGSLPDGWVVGKSADGGLLFQRRSEGADVEVVIGQSDVAGRGGLAAVTINGHDVKGHCSLDGHRLVHSKDALVMLLGVVGTMRCCQGVSYSHLVADENVGESAALGFHSVVRRAMRTLETKPDMAFGDGGRWNRADVKGCLEGRHGVSGILGTVGGSHVLWSKGCTAIVTNGGGHADVVRCGGCKKFYRLALQRRVSQAVNPDPHKNTANEALSTVQKDRKMHLLAEEVKKEREAKLRLVERVQAARKECVSIKGEKGDALHQLLLDEETTTIFQKKLPPASAQRAIFEDQLRWNTEKGKARGFRFHPATLRVAIYMHGVAGTAAYNLLRGFLHLPSPSRIKQLQRQAAPPRTGVLIDNIKKYGRLAAAQDVNQADLTGVLSWDLMHLSKNGFDFAPGAGGLQGLVDETTFFNPIYQGKADTDGDLEKQLERILATQYVEMYFVSLGNPEYKFVVWREAVRALSTDYIQRMLMTTMRYLAIAHEDKGFDVIATVCDGASEHRSFQTRAATETFKAWSRGGGEILFDDFRIGFRHPHHLGEVFNMSDPMHILKKIVNALWHSDIADKKRELGMWLPDAAGDLEFNNFSLRTAERVYNEIENEGDRLSLNERSASLRTFRHHFAAMWRRTSHSCMNVSHSAKVLSGTIIRAIREFMETQDERDGALEAYLALACVMDDFVDIFNGNFGRSQFERRSGKNKMKGYIRSSESILIDRLMEILAFFDDWQATLQLKYDGTGKAKHAWKKHFITRESWHDLRLCILGFVSMCRYLFADPDRYEADRLSPNSLRFFSPRTCSQDICEHRFAHIRAGLGTHKNPTARMAKRKSMLGDQNRAVHGGSRMNANKNARKAQDLDLGTKRSKLMLCVTGKEREALVRARSRNQSVAVLCPRLIASDIPVGKAKKEEPAIGVYPYKFGFLYPYQFGRFHPGCVSKGT